MPTKYIQRSDTKLGDRADDRRDATTPAESAPAGARDSSDQNVALARFILARALISTKGDKKRARKLAEDARAYYSKINDTGMVKRVDAWLAKPR